MPTQARVIVSSIVPDGFRIFLASPGGLDAHRIVAREQFERVRLRVASRFGIDFDPVGWEDLPPGFGRPQGVINPRVDECNVLIGILGKELGTPTGEAASGFVEEYERMTKRAKKGEAVAIWIYALRLTPEDMEDPGEKLKAVLAFRERLFNEALVKEFDSVDDFALKLHQDLVSLVLDAVPRDDVEREASVDVVTPRPPPEEESSDKAGQQLRDLFTEAAEAAPQMPDQFREERFPLARLGLWLSAWEGWHFTNDVFGVHQLNRVYTMRARLEMSWVERRQVLRTMCSDQAAAPGWALLQLDDGDAAPELLTLAAGDRDQDVRRGAFEMLEPEALDAWLARDDVDLTRTQVFARLRDQAEGMSTPARNAMIGFAARLGGEESQALLKELAGQDFARPESARALIRLCAREAADQMIELVQTDDVDLDDTTLAAVQEAARELELTDLERLASAADERARTVAVRLLAAHGPEAVPALMGRLDDASDEVVAGAFTALCEIAPPEIDLEELSERLAEREDLRLSEEVQVALSRNLATDQLRESIDWLNLATAARYQVLAAERWAEFQEIVRRDLADEFTSFAQESRDQLRERFGAAAIEAIETGSKPVAVSGETVEVLDPKSVEQLKNYIAGSNWNNRQFGLAALAGLARNGEAADASIVRPWLESDENALREAAAMALGRVGSTDDVPRLVQLSNESGNLAFAQAALALSPGPAGAALSLLDSSSDTSALLAARHLYAHSSELSDEAVATLLHHDNANVRQVGVACVLASSEAEAAQDRLTRYTDEGHYYYNVVFWLDRALFAPPSLRERTRVELAAFADEVRPPEVPSASGRLRRLLLGRLVDSGSTQ